MTMYGCPKSRRFQEDWKRSRLETTPVDLDEDAVEEPLDAEGDVGEEEEDFEAFEAWKCIRFKNLYQLWALTRTT